MKKLKKHKCDYELTKTQIDDSDQTRIISFSGMAECKICSDRYCFFDIGIKSTDMNRRLINEVNRKYFEKGIPEQKALDMLDRLCGYLE